MIRWLQCGTLDLSASLATRSAERTFVWSGNCKMSGLGVGAFMESESVVIAGITIAGAKVASTTKSDVFRC